MNIRAQILLQAALASSLAIIINSQARAGDISISAFSSTTLHQAGAPVVLLTVGEIDNTHPGPELLAVDLNGVIWQLNPPAVRDAQWTVQSLSIKVESSPHYSPRPAINIGDVNPNFSGNEIVIETNNTVSVLARDNSGQWQKQIVLDGTKFFGICWGVRVGDIDPNQPGQELFYMTESAGDVSAGYFAHLVNNAWVSQFMYQGEVGMDSAIGDTNSDFPGNEIVIATEMGPTYEITPQPGNPDVWPRRTLWDDFANAGVALRIADVLPDETGNEIAYATRYSDSLLLSRQTPTGHVMEVIFTGPATEPIVMFDVAAGDVLPSSPSLEIVGVDELGLAYMTQYDGSDWSGETIWQDTSTLYAAIVADLLPQRPGDEIIVAGNSGAITLITQPVPADITGDGVVDVDDLLALINSWGQCAPPPQTCPADLAPIPDGNGVVDVDDLLIVINNWG